jgi:hypothetical protein
MQKRMVDGVDWWLHPEGPYKTLTDLWDYEELTGAQLTAEALIIQGEKKFL